MAPTITTPRHSDSLQLRGDRSRGGWTPNTTTWLAASVTVSVGQVITQAQANAVSKLGQLASSGNSNGVHLHWGVYYNGHLVEPMVDKADYLNLSARLFGKSSHRAGHRNNQLRSRSRNLRRSQRCQHIFSTFALGQTAYSWRPRGMDPTDQVRAVWHRLTIQLHSPADHGTATADSISGSHSTFHSWATLGPGGSIGQSTTWLRKARFLIYKPLAKPSPHLRGSEYIVDGRTSPLDYGTLCTPRPPRPS